VVPCTCIRNPAEPVPDLLIGIPDIPEVPGGQKLLPYHGDLPLHFPLVIASIYLCRVDDKPVMFSTLAVGPVENGVMGNWVSESLTSDYPGLSRGDPLEKLESLHVAFHPCHLP